MGERESLELTLAEVDAFLYEFDRLVVTDIVLVSVLSTAMRCKIECRGGRQEGSSDDGARVDQVRVSRLTAPNLHQFHSRANLNIRANAEISRTYTKSSPSLATMLSFAAVAQVVPTSQDTTRHKSASWTIFKEINPSLFHKNDHAGWAAPWPPLDWQRLRTDNGGCRSSMRKV